MLLKDKQKVTLGKTLQDFTKTKWRLFKSSWKEENKSQIMRLDYKYKLLYLIF